MNAFLEDYLTKVREEMDNEKEFGEKVNKVAKSVQSSEDLDYIHKQWDSLSDTYSLERNRYIDKIGVNSFKPSEHAIAEFCIGYPRRIVTYKNLFELWHKDRDTLIKKIKGLFVRHEFRDVKTFVATYEEFGGSDSVMRVLVLEDNGAYDILNDYVYSFDTLIGLMVEAGTNYPVAVDFKDFFNDVLTD